MPRYNPKKIVRALYLRTRWWMGKHEPTLLFVLLRKDLSRLLVTRKSDLVIEGYPRSGNTFVEVAFAQAQEPAHPVIATHLHLPAHISRAVRLKKPCLVIIREPLEAIASLLTYYNGNYPAKQAIMEYIDFYTIAHSHHKDIELITFEEAHKNVGNVMHKLNEHFKCNFNLFNHTDENVQKCFAIIEQRATKKYGTSSNTTLRAARPTKERTLLKNCMRKELLKAKHARLIKQASSIYEELSLEHPPVALEINPR